MNRSLLTLTGGAVLLILACVGGLAWMGVRAGALGDRLVREANAREQAPPAWPRPSHALQPTAGSFGEALEALMPEVVRLYKPANHTLFSNECTQVARGEEPFEALSPGCRQLLASHKEVLSRVLAATHREVGGLPEGLRSLSDPQHPYQTQGQGVLRMLIRLAQLETRRHLVLHEQEAAVDTCLDGLALSRELALGGGLTSRLISVFGYEQLYPLCAEALDTAPVERKRQALEQLARLREGFPPLSRVIHDEALLTQLLHYGSMLSEEQRAALAPHSMAIVRNGYGLGILPGPAVLARTHWRSSRAIFEAMVAAGDLPPDERRKAFDRIEDGLRQRLFAVPPEETRSLAVMANRFDRQRFLVDALWALVEVDLARTAQGAWPSTLPPAIAEQFSLKVSQPTEAVLQPLNAAWEESAPRVTADIPL